LSDGDDGGFAMDESTILKGKTKSYEVDHKALSVEDLERQMEKDAEQFASIFGLDVCTLSGCGACRDANRVVISFPQQ
jgi:hypothetical protein